MGVEAVKENRQNIILEENRRQALTNLSVALMSPEETFLREHQISMLQALYDFLSLGGRAGYMSEPTGSGKSIAMVKIAEATGLRTVILSPTQQILEQTHSVAQHFTPGLNMTNYYAEGKDLSGRVINTTYQSMLSLTTEGERNEDFKPEDVQLVICDEAHLALGEIRHTFFRAFPNALLIGFTATPHFTPLEGFIKRRIVKETEEWTALFKNCIHEMTLEEAMERGILTPLDIQMITTNVIVKDIQVQAGEYLGKDLERYFNTRSRNALAIGLIIGIEALPKDIALPETQKKAIEGIHEAIRGKRTVIFGISIDHVNALVEQLRSLGISAAAVHTKVPSEKRREILKAHARGEIKVVLGVDMLRLGWDSPATEVGLYLQPTLSGVVKTQELGRILRPSPETGKQKAVAIELVDQIQRRTPAPILIPHIFDPEYVLRGTTTGQERQVTGKAAHREKPIITFSGMNIESIIEEARSQELLRRRFSQVSVLEMANFLDKITNEIHAQYPKLSIYDFFQMVVKALPRRVLAEAQQKALQALASIDLNTREIGKKAFWLLNLKTILTAVDFYLTAEGPDERDEMIGEAIAYLSERFTKIRPNLPVSQQVYQGIRRAIAQYIVKRDGIPWELVENLMYRLIVITIQETLGGSRPPTQNEIDELAKDLSQETGAPESRLREYITFRASQTSFKEEEVVPDEDEEDKTVKGIFEKDLGEQIAKTLGSLGEKERRAINMLFGLGGLPQTYALEEVGREFAVTRERIRQIEAKALRKLRHPSRAKWLRSYYSGFDASIGSPVLWLESYSLLDVAELGSAAKELLEQSGIRKLSDFFSAAPQEIFEAWVGKPKRFRGIIKKVLDGLRWLYRQALLDNVQNIDLLIELANAALYRDREAFLSALSLNERLAIEEGKNTQEDWFRALRKIFIAAYADLSFFYAETKKKDRGNL